MAVLTIDVTLSDGTERRYTFDPDEATLGQMEQLEDLQDKVRDGKGMRLRDVIPVAATILGIEPAAVREITLRDWRAIQEALVHSVNPTSA